MVTLREAAKKFDPSQFQLAIRPKEWQERGIIRAQVKDDFYQDLVVETICPKWYYKSAYHNQDEYSRRLLNTKKTGLDDSEYFNPFVKDCIEKYRQELALDQVDYITLIPNSNNKYYENIVKVAEYVSELLDMEST